MKRPGVYIETSVVSYLAGHPSSDLLTAACQQATREWWGKRRRRYNLFISELVVLEARVGDADAAARRLRLLRGIPELAMTGTVRDLAGHLLEEGALPAKAQADALHIATAAAHRADYLLTWNCRHIDNPAAKPAVRRACASWGIPCPEICTPIEMMEVGREEE